MDIYSAALEGNDYMTDGALDYCEFAMEGANIDFTKRYRAIVKEVKSKYKEAKQLAKEGYPNRKLPKLIPSLMNLLRCCAKISLIKVLPASLWQMGSLF